MSNVTGISPAAAEHTLGSQVLGVVVTFVGAAMLALSMSVQRYALAHTEGRVPMLGRTLPRTGAWCVGLALYGVANVCKVLGFQFASFTILASVFTTLLGFNLIFGRWLLKEEITLAKAAGTAFIFIGAVTCTAGTPSGVQTEFSPGEVLALLRSPPPGGAFYLFGVIGAVGALGVFTFVCERRYPLRRAAVAPEPPIPPTSAAHDAANGSPRVGAAAGVGLSQRAGLGEVSTYRGLGRSQPPTCLRYAMCALYPAALGIDESVADLCVKAASSMTFQCADRSKAASCDHWVVFLM